MEHCRNGAAYSRNIANSVGHVLRYAMRDATQELVSVYAMTYVMGDARRDSGTGIEGTFRWAKKKPLRRGAR